MIRGQVFVYKYLVVFNSFENICHQSGFVHIQNILPFILSWALAKSLLITTVSVDMKSGDNLTLKATLDTLSESTALHNGSQTVTLTFQNVPADLVEQNIILSISGHQTVSGYFLFDASGERGASQTMVGMDNSRLPVYAEVVAQEERVISITKTTTSGVALEGIIFDIYPKASLEDYLSGKFSIDNPTSTTDLADYTLITNASGKASLNLTHHGLADGVYLVVERQHPAIVKPIDPFYLIVPMTNKDGTGYDYEIKLYPKNEVKGGVKIEKDVLKLNNNEASVDAYSDHTWILSASIPDDIAQGKSYVISDTLDNRLDYAGNVVVTVETTDGETVAATLEANTDYTLTVTNVNSLEGEKPSDAFTLALTDNAGAPWPPLWGPTVSVTTGSGSTLMPGSMPMPRWENRSPTRAAWHMSTPSTLGLTQYLISLWSTPAVPTC